MTAEPQASSPASAPPGAAAAPSRARRVLRGLGRLLGGVLLALVFVYALGRWRGPSLPTAPELDLVDLRSGDRVALASLRGKPAVLNFWASWCGPCRVELPALARFSRSHPELRVLGVTHDEARDILKAADEAGADYAQLHDPSGRVSRAYGVSTLPTTVVLNAAGDVVWTYTGILLDPHLYWLGLTL